MTQIRTAELSQEIWKAIVCGVLAVVSGLPWNAVGADGKKAVATPAEQLQVLPGFEARLLHSAATNEGSWISMTVDPKGRLIVSPQQDDLPLWRITVSKSGEFRSIESIPVPLHQAMGMCYAHNSLYVNGHGPKGTGLYRIIDANHNDQFEPDEVQFLKAFGGEGEHGYHAVVPGPDGMIYVMNGNHTRLPKGLEPTSPHRNYQEDLLLPRQWDANGHAAGVLAPGGHILRTDPEGNKWELVLAGFRNAYDFDFNAEGEIFTFDSDMEWDWGLPWYRPTRILHCVSGGEYGWRSGSGKWPEDYPDSLPATWNAGIGSPTGVKFGTESRFPGKYRQALYAMDWSYGRIFAVHLTPQGASYKASAEVLVKGKPLNVTDLEFGKDGAMYFITGGRGTQSGLYRVTYSGGVPSATLRASGSSDRVGRKARRVRRQLEGFHGKQDPKAVDLAWKHLGDPDPFVRYAARIALEWQDVKLWQRRALAEKKPGTGLEALLALARCGGRETQQELLRAVERFGFDSLGEAERLQWLRVVELSCIRQGRPEPENAQALVGLLEPRYPCESERLNRELVQVMVYLGAPNVVGKTLNLLERLPKQEEQIHYIFALRNVKSGWTLEQRRRYFEWFPKNHRARESEPPSKLHDAELVNWFTEAGREYSDGASFPRYLVNIRKEAIATLTPDEFAALGALLQENIGTAEWKPSRDRKFVKEWAVSDIEPLLGQAGKGRDFKSGKAAFNDAQCVMCHRFSNEGGSVGPELTGVGSKYSVPVILESLIEPSKVISDQYQNVTILKKEGEEISGRITSEDDERLIICPSMLVPESTVEVRKADVVRRSASKVSPMPNGLLNNLTAEEILDLIAYLESGGKEDAACFKEAPRLSSVPTVQAP